MKKEYHCSNYLWQSTPPLLSGFCVFQPQPPEILLDTAKPV